MSPEATATAAGIAYVADGRVLLLMRSADSEHYPSTWSFPAGKIEDGETPQQGARRESMEEVAHQPGEMVAVSEHDGFALFACAEPRFLPVLNEEHEGYVWAPLDALPAPLHPGVAGEVAMAAEALSRPVDPQEDATSAMDESARQLDTNGWFAVDKNPISKVGVFQYRGRQLDPGGRRLEPDRFYGVYRPAEELSKPEAMASFCLLPWIDEHVMLGSEERGRMPAEKKGIQGVTGEQVSFEDDTLYINVKCLSEAMAGLIASGKEQLSCGYSCRYETKSGVFNGETYDFIQRDIRGNHLALVKAGRMGPEVSVLDSIDSPTTTVKEPPMAEEKEEGGSGMTLEAALEAFKQFMPAFTMLSEHIASMSGTNTAAAVDADEKKDGDKSDEKKDEKKDDKVAEAKDSDDATKNGDGKPDGKKEAMAEDAMDALAQAALKKYMVGVKRRDALAKDLSAHVGTFDHSDMTEAEVAKYGAKKLGIDAPSGQEAAALAGYLKAAGNPARKPVAAARDAMDAATAGDNFVTRYLNKKEA